MVAVVWFKRDFRTYDHAPLHAAEATGQPVLPLYITEPDYWQLPDTSYRQWRFMYGCLKELDTDLKQLGAPLINRTGNAVDILAEFHAQTPITGLYSHMETGNMWTFQRDLAVKKWCKDNNIPWYEYRQFGVQRGNFKRSQKGKDTWAAQWNSLMTKPQLPSPTKLIATAHQPEALPTASDLHLAPDGLTTMQPAGRTAGQNLLYSFLYERGEFYQTDMSSPIKGEGGCSRLSPYITYGCLSLREIAQTAYQCQKELKTRPPDQRGKWPRALNAFIGRLHWHCHFIQKLEAEPALEFQNMNRTYDALDRSQDNEKFTAWATGTTGYPYIDACMRYLIQTGWLNFRARAMLMSFASYHLWLDWRLTAPYLAQLFIDYEPGIHYSQTQMQSGVTGINSVRVYNPVKQGQDFDSEGVFIATHIPELAELPAEYRHQPWALPPLLQADCPGIGTYPTPIINHEEAARTAKQKIIAIRKSKASKTAADEVMQQHGSRKQRPRKKPSNPTKDLHPTLFTL